MEPEDNAERAAVVPTSDPIVLQPSRMDVLVHLLAFEQLANIRTVDVDLTEAGTRSRLGDLPQSQSADDFFLKAHQVDWVARSEAFTSLDGQAPVTERALELDATNDLVVRFAPGGQLVGGAVDAALATFLGRPFARHVGRAQPLDRSINGLREAGWVHGDLRALVHKWAVLDSASAVVLLYANHENFPEAHHELVCRYGIVHSEYDFVTDAERLELQTSGQGSVQSMFLQADPASLQSVLGRHEQAVLGSFVGDFSVVPISVLWSPLRQTATDAEHEQRLRKLRRRELTTQLLDRARRR